MPEGEVHQPGAVVVAGGPDGWALLAFGLKKLPEHGNVKGCANQALVEFKLGKRV